MKLDKLVSECYDALTEDVKKAIRCGMEYACAIVNTNDGYIDLYSNRNGDTEALIYHDDDERDHDDINLETYISKELKKEVDWYAIEEEVREERESYDIWDDHGFNGEDDYRNWKG